MGNELMNTIKFIYHIFPEELLQVHVSYIQPWLDHSITLIGRSTYKNIDLVQ